MNLYEQLAQDRAISRGVRLVAERIADRARGIDPLSTFEVRETQENVLGLTRRSYLVVNTDDGAAGAEFGGKMPLRPLGRAADGFRDRPHRG